jgi:hypothetical protein
MGCNKVTQTSKSKTRRVAAIGNGCVIPAKAGIHFAAVKSQWIPAFAGMTDQGASVIPAKAGIQCRLRRSSHATNAIGFPLAREQRIARA